jgi:hypothetical protein
MTTLSSPEADPDDRAGQPALLFSAIDFGI